MAPLQVFDVADISKAYRYFSSPNRIGKIAISLKNPKSQIKVRLNRNNQTCSSSD